jgi:hypothetical protein
MITIWFMFTIKFNLIDRIVHPSAVVHLGNIHDDVVNGELSDEALFNTFKVGIFGSMDDCFRRNVCLTKFLVIPVHDLVVYPAIEVTGLDAVNDLACWCEFLVQLQDETSERRNDIDSLLIRSY